MPARFEARGLCYRFRAINPEVLAGLSEVKEWTAKIRMKGQLHDRGDHYEVELLALPKANAITIYYTTDGSSPANVTATTYDGKFRVPQTSRIVCAMAVCAEYEISSEILRIQIPQRGQENRPSIDPTSPARWNQQTKLDDSGAVWDFIQRLEQSAGVRIHDIGLTAESADGHQNVEYSGALEGGYDGAAVKSISDILQGLVGGGSLRMTVGSIAFPTGQALLDWLQATNQQFNLARVGQ